MKAKIFSIVGAVICLQISASAADKFTPPASPRATYNFNPGWKFVFGDAAGADAAGLRRFGVGQRQPAAHVERDRHLPHLHQPRRRRPERKNTASAGIASTSSCRPAPTGQKVFIQFDGMRQAGRFFLNGQPVGKYENGVTAVGIDISKFVEVRRPGQCPRGEGGQQPRLQGGSHRHGRSSGTRRISTRTSAGSIAMPR